MTDAEINLAIAKIEYPDKEVGSLDNGSAFVVYHPRSGVRNYIKYWGDIGPILDREEINLNKHDWGLWVAFTDDHEYYDLSPTKAVAVCFLKIKGVDI